MEIFLTIGHGCKELATKSFILGITRVLDVPQFVVSYKAFGNKHWLGKVLGKVPKDSFIVTTNVVGLYPSIKEQIRGTSLLKIPTNDLVKLAEFLLKNIFLELDNEIKQQICGTATGTNFAPPYVCIYINKTEFLWSVKFTYQSSKNRCILDLNVILENGFITADSYIFLWSFSSIWLFIL